MHKKPQSQSPEFLVQVGRPEEVAYAVYMMKMTLSPQLSMPKTTHKTAAQLVERDMFEKADDLGSYSPHSFTPARHESTTPETVIQPAQDAVADEMEQLALKARTARDEAFNSTKDDYGLTA